MKIKIQEALDSLLEDERIDSNCNIEIQNSYDYYPPNKPKLTWKIYATDAKSKKSTWSEEKPEFSEALTSLIAKFKEARGEQSFIEE